MGLVAIIFIVSIVINNKNVRLVNKKALLVALKQTLIGRDKWAIKLLKEEAELLKLKGAKQAESKKKLNAFVAKHQKAFSNAM